MQIFTPSLIAMQSFQYTMRTAYADTDQMGFVHHSSYVKYLENARWYAFRQMAIPYKEIEKNGILLPVIHLDIQFIRPLYYDDMVRIDVWIDLVRMTKLEVRYSIFNESPDNKSQHYPGLSKVFNRQANGYS